MNITPTAKSEIQKLVGDGYFCPYAIGNNLDGFQYGVCVGKFPSECDIIIEDGEIKILLDPLSYQQLKDSEIDFNNRSIIIRL